MSNAKENIFFFICKVHFDQNNAPIVAIVPNIWVQNFYDIFYCYWPPQKFKVAKMIKLAVLPETWFQYPCKVLKQFGMLL